MARTAKPAIDESVEIGRPIDVVWAAIIDWPGAGEWLPNVTFCEDPSEIHAGDRIAFRYRDEPSTVTIDEVSPPFRLVMRRTNEPVDATFAYDLTESPQGTSVRLQADIAAAKGLWFMRRALRMALARTDRSQLDRLKAMVESSDDTS